MPCPIYAAGRLAGSLRWEKNGLYYDLYGRCRREEAGVLRLYAVNGFSVRLLGVLQPEDGELTLRRRLSEAAMGQPPQWAVAGRAAEDFLPWRGLFEQTMLDQAMLRREQEGFTLALPYSPDRPFALPEAVSRMHPVTLNGQTYLALEIKEQPPETDGCPECEKEEVPVAGTESVDDSPRAVEVGENPGVVDGSLDDAQLGVGGMDEHSVAHIDADVGDVVAAGGADEEHEVAGEHILL